MIKRLCTFLFILSFVVFSSDIFMSPPVMAANSMDVVINEIAWAGSADNSLDEWIELYNNTSSAIDLTGWKIEDDNGAQLYTLSGSIPAHGYFLLESRESATSLPADQIRTLSLSNSGDAEVLKDNSNNIIDTVNSTSGAWFAGSTTSHATMERVSTTASGDNTSNWQSSTGGGSATSSLGTAITGTPKASNSGIVIGPELHLITNQTEIVPGQEITLTLSINNAVNVSNYGLDITYDETKLHYVESNERPFLSENGTVATFFQSGLENGDEGTVIVGNARTVNPLTGVNGNGELLTITFEVLDEASGNTAINIANTSFLSAPTSNISIGSWPNLSLAISPPTSTNPVTNLHTNAGTERYSISLQWNSVPGTNISYKVYRRNAHGAFSLLGTSTANTFLDHDGITNGGNIIPNLTYEYQVITVSGTQESTPVLSSGSDVRGLKGDNTRSDRVDGHDLENIAKSWTINDTQTSFSPLVDTSFDGNINGNDLIDLAVSWAKTYP